MKVIYPDNISSILASAENANYPATNVQDKHPKKIWKSTGQTATLTLYVSSGAAVAVFATNAESVSVTIREGVGLDWGESQDFAIAAEDGSEINTESGSPIMMEPEIDWTGQIDWQMPESVSADYDLSGSNVGSMWADYGPKSGAHAIDLDFTAPADSVVEAGIVRAGTVKEYKDPKYGIREGLVDYSIVRELNNGAFYTRKRDIVRTFSFSVLEDRKDDTYEFLHLLAQLVGPDPVAWRLVYNSNEREWEWVVFCRFDGAPQADHIAADLSSLSVNLIEVI